MIFATVGSTTGRAALVASAKIVVVSFGHHPPR
jgi:hypothetical protein